MEPRPLTDRERAVLDALLAVADFDGADALRQQAHDVEVVGTCGCGCPSIDFVQGRGLGMTLRVDAAVRESDTNGLFLYTNSGHLQELERAVWARSERVESFGEGEGRAASRHRA